MTNSEIDRVDLLTRSRISECGGLAQKAVEHGKPLSAFIWALRAAHGARQAWPELFIWDETVPYGHQLELETVA